MTTYQNQDFDAERYNAARPTYPDTFYDHLVEHHKKHGGSPDLAMDVGCGPGFVAFKLLNYFKQVVGTDFSSTMIEHCDKDPRVEFSDKIRFYAKRASRPQKRSSHILWTSLRRPRRAIGSTIPNFSPKVPGF